MHNHNDRLDFVNPYSFKRIGFSLAWRPSRPFRDLFCSATDLGSTPSCLLSRVLSGPRLLPSRLLWALSSLGPGPLGRSADSPWVAKGLDPRLLGISEIDERDWRTNFNPFHFLTLCRHVCPAGAPRAAPTVKCGLKVLNLVPFLHVFRNHFCEFLLLPVVQIALKP